MESEDKPIERNIYHFLYYSTGKSDPEDAVVDFKTKLEKIGYSPEFIATMQFDVWEPSVITGNITVSAAYWS